MKTIFLRLLYCSAMLVLFALIGCDYFDPFTSAGLPSPPYAGARIYISDSGNDRIVRMGNMSGAGWIEFGAGYLSTPHGVFVR